jgi:Dolichyl-phosphate-mannose-protein mannosyltransferase
MLSAAGQYCDVRNYLHPVWYVLGIVTIITAANSLLRLLPKANLQRKPLRRRSSSVLDEPGKLSPYDFGYRRERHGHVSLLGQTGDRSGFTRLVWHWPIVAVVLAGFIVRLVFWLTYWPGLMFADSWSYLGVVRQLPGGTFPTDRPAGYALVLRLLTIISGNVQFYVAVQHALGLCIGLLIYLILHRLGVGRWIATIAASVVILDGYLITTEQYVMAETVFAFGLTACVWLLVSFRGKTSVLCSGLFLSFAILTRSEGLFAVPFWAVYVLFRYRQAVCGQRVRRRVVAYASIGLLPVLGYAGLHALAGEGFGLSNSTGLLLYARAASALSCKGVQLTPGLEQLCPDRAGTPHEPSYYAWNDESPVVSVLGGAVFTHNNDQLLRGFALQLIRAQPVTFAHAVGLDFVSLFSPCGRGTGDSLALPDKATASASLPSAFVRHQQSLLLPDYHVPAPGRSAFAARYRHYMRFPRPLYGLSMAFPVILLMGSVRKSRRRIRGSLPELFLLVGISLGCALASVATVGLVYRYALPVLPLGVCSGALALSRWGRYTFSPRSAFVTPLESSTAHPLPARG